MNIDTNTPSLEAKNAENYSKAMNFIGQSLHATLTQALQQLPIEFRNKKVVTQGLSAFLTNVIYKQSPGNQASCQEMLAELTDFVRIQLENLQASTTR